MLERTGTCTSYAVGVEFRDKAIGNSVEDSFSGAVGEAQWRAKGRQEKFQVNRRQEPEEILVEVLLREGLEMQ